ncbi:DUF1501 domain-containing protein [Aliigemmobacter aestuarii]|uniref:DUF1501 domain-containing protein n=1 Tax=Aliigemmobacter aestuarii TaxID=1445661 RepID=A0A4S3MJV1_9RHOB|nr:DUF1501 domain-containing protein [Gemmobacter aestuarii]THD81496.1 DUF1501 domain-containing protein [Gemmobacter aestuarii]
MDRRFFLRGAMAVGCSAAAHPLTTTMTFASGDPGLGENRLVVIILRGAMDGLDVVQPLGDRAFAGYRPTLGVDTGALALDGYFAMNRHLGGWKGLWDKGELGFVHAVSTPYRDKRSHFDGQDLLEAGTGTDVAPGQMTDGWLNRMLQAVPGLRAETAYAVGRDPLPVLDGKAWVRNWSPDLRMDLSPQSRLLLEAIYHDDDLFRDAAFEALDMVEEAAMRRTQASEAARAMAGADPAMSGMAMEDGMSMVSGMDPGMAGDAAGAEQRARRLADIDRMVDFAAEKLRAETRIAAFSLAGWDTHRAQSGGIQPALARLQRMILRLHERLGPEVWGKTAVLAVTEFGRTVAENGTGGTDHGTGGAMVTAGGALRGGRVMGRWPGLAEADLYDRRDLMPTSDVRAWAAWTMRGLYGFDRSVLERSVFPGLDMGEDPGLVL